MKIDIFKQANACISRTLIEKLFSSPGAKWGKDEYWTLSPLRNDNGIGSFHIKANGQYYDHATGDGGDLIDLVKVKENITKKEAAEKIIRESGGIVPEKKTEKLIEKSAPVIPIPENVLKKLNTHVKGKFIVEKYGRAVAGWEYRKDGKVWMSVCRHEKDGKKNIIPYYFGNDQKWHAGNPISKNRPLYNIDNLGNDPIIIVEGEKCAEIKVAGFVVVTWAGGTSQVQKSDWSVLKNKTVFIWPDLDEPGRKAAIYIQSVLPHAKILDVWEGLK